MTDLFLNKFYEIIPYFLISIIILSYIRNLRDDQYSKSIIVIPLTLFLFSFLRFDVGWDYMEYVSIILNPDLSINYYEPFSNLIFFVGNVSNFAPLSFGIFAFFTLFFIDNVVKKLSTNYYASWLIYYNFPLFYLISLSTLRHSLASSIVLYSIIYILDKKPLKFLMTIGFASLFHVSAIVGLVLLPFIYIKPVKTINYYLIALSIFSIFFEFDLSKLIDNWTFLSELSNKLTYYLTTNADNYKSTKLIYFLIFLSLFNMAYYEKLCRIDTGSKLYILIINFGFCFFTLFAFQPTVSLRILFYFLLFLVLLFPSYLKLFNNLYSRYIISLPLFLLPYYFISLYVTAEIEEFEIKNSFLPYKLWLLEM
jgi:hypothetical protein